MPFNREDYKPAGAFETSGGLLNLGVRISVCGIELTDEESRMISNAAKDLAVEITRQRVLADPEGQKQAAATVQELMDCFPEQSIYVERIPNKYCSGACCVHRPWLIVTTSLGRVEIGWRKRVISINWEDSLVKETADELFPKEPVTREGRLIHAWSYEDAARYLEVILTEDEAHEDRTTVQRAAPSERPAG